MHMKAQETWVISASLYFTTQYACKGRRESDIYNPYFPNNLKMIKFSYFKLRNQVHFKNKGFQKGMCRMIIKWIIVKIDFQSHSFIHAYFMFTSI